MIDWHTGSEDDRNLAVMWTALRLPMQWRASDEDCQEWRDWNYSNDDDDLLDRNFPDYLDGLQLRLKPRD